MMEAARTSETSVDNYFTKQYIPEDKSELQCLSIQTGSGIVFYIFGKIFSDCDILYNFPTDLVHKIRAQYSEHC
jgi:hypothetical protein